MNRKHRRGQKGKPSNHEQEDDLVLARPPETTQPQAKTLYEIAAERQAALTPSKSGSFQRLPSKDNVVNVMVGQDGKLKTLDGSALPGQELSESVSPWLDTLLLATSLSALHFTLEALTVHQYADELRWKHVLWHTVLKAFPVLTLLVHFMHGHLLSLRTSKKVSDAIAGLKQLLFVAVANIAGCYLIYLTNDKGYMAVMKNAPSIGTLWIWSVIELGLAGALVGVAGPGIYAYYYGYGIF
ncbi:hypothetical protein LTR05_006473 [Lithohypha guttulata]|uniref:DUF7719 domain-containing protein n=1 Tax=Lithohypha guttulata TaxID=1690604 RepID=A0AAN7SXL2_9EURO|nr:hypothetical protein LTR05_006473 [Lithohypha guttulata]